jgi:oxygen-independent coproporphyrinogen-3 oxidase
LIQIKEHRRTISRLAQDRVRAHIIERLMCDFAVDLAACAGAEHIDFTPEFEALASLRAEGLVTIDGAFIKITEQGRPFVRLAAAAFDAYLAHGAARHSRAV